MAMTPNADAAGPDAARVAAFAAGGLGLALSVAAIALFGLRTSLSVAVGAMIAVANLVTMSAIIRALVRSSDEADADTASAEAAAPHSESAANSRAADEASSSAAASATATTAEADPSAEAAPPVDHRAEGRRGGAAWGGFALLKIIVLFGGIWILLTRGWVDPIPLVVGYGVLPLGIAASSVLSSLAPRRTGRRTPRKPG
jgi:predicted lipid-binding transport protein (Tim44 family)